jgi:hypothetical protein
MERCAMRCEFLRNLLRLVRDGRGSHSVELVYVLGGLTLLTAGIVDFGRAVFDWNAVEKAVQVGAREAVVRDPIALPIKTYFECNPPADPSDPNTGLGAWCADANGALKAQCNFGTVVCTSTGCTRNGTGLASTKVDQTIFNSILAAMHGALPRLQPENVTIRYTPTALGFIGKPKGPIPEVTAQVSNVPFNFSLLEVFGNFTGVTLTVPTLSVTLTGEDLSNNSCAEQGMVEGNVGGELVCQPGGGGGGGGGGGSPLCF